MRDFLLHAILTSFLSEEEEEERIESISANMDLRLTIFCCLLGVTTVFANQGGFYFPDQINAKADANSQAWSDGFGNSQANANSNAVSSSNGGGGYPSFYKPDYPPGHGGFSGQDDFGGRYPSQGFGSDYENLPPYDPRPSGYPSYGGNSQSNANAQANSQGFGGNTISNAVAGSQSLGANGGASSSAAAASAGTSFVNGIPVASASAAAAAAVASPHGASSSAVSSSATAGGNGGFQGQQYPGGPFGFNRPSPYQQPWLYRSGFDKEESNDSDVVESARSSDTTDTIIFKD